MNIEAWSSTYQEYLNTPPKPGDILRAPGGEYARLDLDMVAGKPPFVYGRAFVPCIVGEAIGWFLQNSETDTAYGFKCILLPKAREECLRRRGTSSTRLQVKALKVVRASQTGASLLVEVHEYD